MAKSYRTNCKVLMLVAMSPRPYGIVESRLSEAISGLPPKMADLQGSTVKRIQEHMLCVLPCMTSTRMLSHSLPPDMPPLEKDNKQHQS